MPHRRRLQTSERAARKTRAFLLGNLAPRDVQFRFVRIGFRHKSATKAIQRCVDHARKRRRDCNYRLAEITFPGIRLIPPVSFRGVKRDHPLHLLCREPRITCPGKPTRHREDYFSSWLVDINFHTKLNSRSAVSTIDRKSSPLNPFAVESRVLHAKIPCPDGLNARGT